MGRTRLRPLRMFMVAKASERCNKSLLQILAARVGNLRLGGRGRSLFNIEDVEAQIFTLSLNINRAPPQNWMPIGQAESQSDFAAAL